MLDAADSKKNDDMLFERLQNITKELRLLTSENQKYKDEISNLKRQIHQLEANQSVGRTDFLSHEHEYRNFSLVIYEQIKDIRDNQNAGDIRLTEIKEHADRFMKNLTSITDDMQKLETKYQRQNEEIADLKEEHTNLNTNISHLQSQPSDGSRDIRNCFLNLNCYVQMNFTFDDSYNACHGDMFIKSSNYNPGKYVGIILCSPTRYHLFMSDDINGMFYNIADSRGQRQDHCEQIGGRRKSQGYWRKARNEPFEFGNIGYSSRIGSWLECGVTIPDDIIVY